MFKHGRLVYLVYQFILPLQNSHYIFHIIFIYHALYFPTRILTLYLLSVFNFVFNQSHLKAGIVNQMIHLCFRKRSTVGQLNVLAAAAKKKK